MHALFIHGMGRTQISGWALLRKLRSCGIGTSSFGYSTALQNFPQISNRLASRISTISVDGEYILIGHSLGGVLLRSALASLAVGMRPPTRVFLLGSPTKSARLAKILSGNPIFRLATGDCGQMLASDARMHCIPPLLAPTTGVFGDRGIPVTRHVFQGEQNDGVVSVSEVSATWITDTVIVPIVHTFLPASGAVAAIIMERLRTCKGDGVDS